MWCSLLERLSLSNAHTCLYPPCARFGASVPGTNTRFCESCRRPLGGATFGSAESAGPYRVDGFLGSGYYADVVRVVDSATGGHLAAKVYADEPAKRVAADREVAALRRLEHPRLPLLVESFEDGEERFVIMELVAGENLRTIVEARGPLDADRVVRMGIDVFEALEYVAAQGWTYRDLHPKNIFPDTPRGAMLVDFDGARPPGWPAQPSGRIGYRAPELEAGPTVSPACDVYSAAGCLYFALTGDDPPFEPGPLQALRDLLSPGSGLADLLDECRRADPAERPSAETLRAALAIMLA